MYCRIRLIECPSAREIMVKNHKALEEKDLEVKYTICCGVGGRLGCTK